MPTPPTHVANYESAVGTGTSKTINNVACQPGDILLVFTSTYDNAGSDVLASAPTTSTGTWTWTVRQSIMISGYCSSKVWTATVPAGVTSVNITTSCSASSHVWATTVDVWRDHDGVGASAKGNGSGAPSVSLVTTAADSAIWQGNSDWNAASGARTVRAISGATFIEESYLTGSQYVRYNGRYSTAGAAGSKTTGWSAPTGQKWAHIAVEIKGKAVTGPSVNAGADVDQHRASTEFTRTATEDPLGSTITSRAWTIVSGPAGVGTTIGTSAALAWTPTVAGSYVLRYSATNANGTGTDEMAIGVLPSYVRGWSVAQSNTSTVSVPRPPGVQEDDNMVAFCINDFIAADSTGWERPSAAGSSTTDSAFNIFQRTATATEATSYDFSVGASTSATIAIIAFAKEEIDTLWDVAPSIDTLTATTTATTSPPAPSITAVEDGALLLTCYGSQEGSSGFSGHVPPSGMTEILDYVPAGTGRALTVAALFVPPGATGVRTATVSGTGRGYLGQSMTIRPGIDSIEPAGIPSAEVFGSVWLNQTVPMGDIPSEEAFGAVRILAIVQTQPTGSEEAFGNPVIAGGIVVTGIPSEEAFGDPSVGNFGVGPVGIPSEEAFGPPVVLRAAILVKPSSIGPQAGVGTPTVFNYGLGPTGIPSQEASGTPTVIPGPVDVVPAGAESAEAFGETTIHNYGLGPAGIPSGETFGEVWVLPQVKPGGIPTAEALGEPVLSYRIHVLGIESEEAFGSTAGEIPEPRPRRIPQRTLARYVLRCMARIPQTAGPPTFLEVESVEWTGLGWADELDRPQRLDVGCKISRLSEPVLQRLESPGDLATELWLTRNGRMVFAGPVMNYLVQGQDALTIQAVGILGYLDYAFVTETLNFKQIDQALIVRDLVDHWQNQEYGHFGIDTSSITPTGMLRDATYEHKEEHQIGQRIAELGARNNGFNIDVDPQTRKIQVWYPTKGVDRSEGEDAIIFDRRNITSGSISVSVAPGDLASEAFATGTGNDTSIYSAKSNLELRAKYGRTGVTATFDGVSEQSTLDDYTQALVDARARPLVIPGADLRTTVDADPAAYDVGDLVAHHLHQRLGVKGAFRIRRRSISVSENGAVERSTLEYV